MTWKSVLFMPLLLLNLAHAQDRPTMGILEAKLAGADADTTLRPLFTAAVRGTAIKLVKDSIDVIEGSKLEKLIQVNALSCSNASCLANFARSAGVDYLLETQMIYRKGNWAAILKLASAKDENLLDEETGDYATEQEAKSGLPDLTSKVLHCLSKLPQNTVVAEDTAIIPLPGPKKYIVSFSSSPSGVAVTLDGKFLCQTNSSKALLPGEHWIEMGQNGYRTHREKVVVSANGQDVAWTLDPIRTRLKLEAIDDRTKGDLIADVYVDGEKVGQTPFDELVPIVASRVDVQSSGLGRKAVPVTLEEGKEANVLVHFMSEAPEVATQHHAKKAKKAKRASDSQPSETNDSQGSSFLTSPSTWIIGGVLVAAVVVGAISKQSESTDNAASNGWTAKLVW